MDNETDNSNDNRPIESLDRGRPICLTSFIRSAREWPTADASAIKSGAPCGLNNGLKYIEEYFLLAPLVIWRQYLDDFNM